MKDGEFENQVLRERNVLIWNSMNYRRGGGCMLSG